MRSDKLALKRHGHSYLWAWPYWICISRSFPFRLKMYGRTVFKWITQRDWLTFALASDYWHLCHYLLHKLFCAWNLCYLLLEVEGRGYVPLILIYFESQNYPDISFAKPCYFLFASGNKRRLGTHRCRAIPDLSKLLQPFLFLASGSFQHTVAYFFIVYSRLH